MVDWSDLVLDLKVKIVEKVEFCEDFRAVGSVCTSWRKATKVANEPSSSRHTPWLMLAEPPFTSKRRFYGLNKRMVREIELPVPPPRRGGSVDGTEDIDITVMFEEETSDWTYFSSRGWLICVTQIGFNVVLIHPITRMVIEPPAVPEDVMRHYYGNYYDTLYLSMFSKFAISEDPLITSNYMLAMIFPTWGELAFWRNGDDHWTLLNGVQVDYDCLMDIVFNRGDLYFLDQCGRVFVLENIGSSSTTSTRTNTATNLSARLVANLRFSATLPGASYLVECAGTLLLVKRKVCSSNEMMNERSYTTLEFKVWEVNVDNGETNEINNLRNRALFLGFNSSFSINASPLRLQGCKPNCIYYTDNTDCFLRLSSPDMGVYDLTVDRKIDQLIEGESRWSSSTCPLWLESPLSENSICLDNYEYTEESKHAI